MELDAPELIDLAEEQGIPAVAQHLGCSVRQAETVILRLRRGELLDEETLPLNTAIRGDGREIRWPKPPTPEQREFTELFDRYERRPRATPDELKNEQIAAARQAVIDRNIANGYTEWEGQA
jgi:hypothetical protein